MPRLFVYGTLKRRCKNHHHLAAQRFIGEARTTAGHRLYDLGDYPGLVLDATDTNGVTGEIWDVDIATLARLDEFEGVTEGLYRRIQVQLQPPHDVCDTCTYLYARNPGTRQLGPSWHEAET
jgi:gamma-glutamylaminecyclotransferase